MNKRIYLSPPHMSGKEIEELKETFNANWIAPSGPQVEIFENQLQKFLNTKNEVVALNSGTSSIHMALILLGIQKGDEVLCQSNTFVATANPILYQGAIPVFIDSEPKTYNLCPSLLEKAIKERILKGKKPKAIIAVHLYGMPYKITEIHKIAEHYNIPVIEDSAEALGSKYHGDNCGTFGDYGIFSFNGNKIITTSAGGALIVKNKSLKKKAKNLAAQAKDQGEDYTHSSIGYNYALSNLLAGIGISQLEVLANRIERRRENFEYYKNHLNAQFVKFQIEQEGFFSNRWLTTVLFNSNRLREEIRQNLEKLNIESRPLWKPMHLQPIFKEYPSYVNGVSEELYTNGLCLPSGSNLSPTELERIVETINGNFNN